MAVSHYGVELTKTHNTTPAFRGKSRNLGGRRRVSYDEYEASAVVVGSQIALGHVPAGAMLLGGCLTHDAMGSGTTLCVGDQFDCDRFKTTAAANLAGSCGLFDVVGDLNADNLHGVGKGYIFPCDTLILVTVPYAGGTITGTIKLEVEYSTA